MKLLKREEIARACPVRPPERTSINGQKSIGTGAVKRYDAEKGCGFILPDDDGGEIMVTADCLRRFGRARSPEANRVKVICAAGPRGRYAAEILAFDRPEPPELFTDAESARPPALLSIEAASGPLMPARVRWFGPEMGYGFVNVFGESEDIFVHMETVRDCGLDCLSDGEAVAVRTCRGPR